MFEGDIGEDPRTKDDSGLEEREEVGLQIHRGYIEMRTDHHCRTYPRENQRNGQEKRRETYTECQHVYDAIIRQRDLLADVIKAQTKGGYKG